MKRILREAVSLGVREIIVTGADTAERSYQDAKLWSTGEYRKYLLDGAMQSGYTGISELRFTTRVDNLKEDFTRMDNLVLLDNVLEGGRLADFSYSGGSVLLAVGPERGWSARERQVLVDSGFSSYSLGKRVLRTETACSAGTAVLLGRMGLL
jgi:RsmE family RNA methyltransferase